MKKVTFNNQIWFVSLASLIMYQNEDKTGITFSMYDTGVTFQDREEVINQLKYKVGLFA